MVKKTNKEYSRLNSILLKSTSKLNDLFINYRMQDIPLTVERLKEDYERPEYVFNFIEFMQAAIEERKGVLTDSTIRQHEGILSKLREFRERIPSNLLTEEFFEEYSRHLKIKKVNNLNTRHGNFKTIRSYIRIAIRKGLLNDIMEKNPVKQVSGKRVYLSDDELRKLIKLYREGTLSESRQAVLRWYLFCCFTGIRISDIKRITFDDIAGDLLIMTPYKTKNVTGKTVKIPPNDMAKQLI